MLSKDFIKNLLKEQKEKILLRPSGIEREILSELAEKIKLPHIIIITGIRRCGKSTLLTQIIKRYFSETNFYYINFDDERWLGFQANDFNFIYEALLEVFGEAKTFFIDEIQNVIGFELFVRRFYDDGFKFIITGSNSDLLSAELGSRLTGRHIPVNLHPFSFREFLSLKQIEIPENKVFTTNEKVSVYKAFSEYFTMGGMPEYVIYQNDEILKQVYNDLVIKDIAQRFNVNHLTAMRDLYLRLITNFANRFSYISLSKNGLIQSPSTIINYINYLEIIYFAKQVRKFDFSVQKSLKNDKKLYIVDNAFIPLLSQSFTPDKGRLFENLVFNVLSRKNEVFFFSAKKECDFITTQNRSVIGAYQVCYELNDNNFQRETEGLLEALEYMQLQKGYILTLENENEITINNKQISILPVWKWLLTS